ncbi:MAG: hypothetical protein KDC48_15275, partial [Planctomycetes bacterium]|nr:hypothetical protein [Planctomycetota bacterium]
MSRTPPLPVSLLLLLAATAPAQATDDLLAQAMGGDRAAAVSALAELQTRTVDQELLCLCIDALSEPRICGEEERAHCARVRTSLVELLRHEHPTRAVVGYAPELLAGLPRPERVSLLRWLLSVGEKARDVWVLCLSGKDCEPAFEVLTAAPSLPLELLGDVGAFVWHPDETRSRLASGVLLAHGGEAALSKARAAGDPWAKVAQMSAFDAALDATLPWFLRVQALGGLSTPPEPHVPRPNREDRTYMYVGVARLWPLLTDDDVSIAAATTAAFARCTRYWNSGAAQVANAERLHAAYADCPAATRPFVGDLIRQSMGRSQVPDASIREWPRLHLLGQDWNRRGAGVLLSASMWSEAPLRAMGLPWYPTEEERVAVAPVLERLYRITGGRDDRLRRHLMATAEGRAFVLQQRGSLDLVDWLNAAASAGDDLRLHLDLVMETWSTAAALTTAEDATRRLMGPLMALPWHEQGDELTEIAARVQAVWGGADADERQQLVAVVAAMGTHAAFAADELATRLTGAPSHLQSRFADTLIALGRGDEVVAWLHSLDNPPLPAGNERYRRLVSQDLARRLHAPEDTPGLWQAAQRWGSQLEFDDRSRIVRRALSQLTEQNYHQQYLRVSLQGPVDDATHAAFAAFFEAHATSAGAPRDDFAEAVAHAIFQSMPGAVLTAIERGQIEGSWLPNLRPLDKAMANRIAPQALRLLGGPRAGRSQGFASTLGQILAMADEIDLGPLARQLDDPLLVDQTL